MKSSIFEETFVSYVDYEQEKGSSLSETQHPEL